MGVLGLAFASARERELQLKLKFRTTLEARVVGKWHHFSPILDFSSDNNNGIVPSSLVGWNAAEMKELEGWSGIPCTVLTYKFLNFAHAAVPRHLAELMHAIARASLLTVTGVQTRMPRTCELVC